MSSKGKEVVPSSGGGWPRCAACQHLQRACGMECVFAPHFPAGDDPTNFAVVHAVFGADNVARFLGSLPPGHRAHPVRWLVLNAPLQLSAAASGGRPPCAACQHLQRTCTLGCVFAPHFPPGDDPARFASVDAAFGADDVALILCGVSPDQQTDAVRWLVVDAQRRLEAPQQPTAAAGPVLPPPLEARRRCAACKHLSRKCEPDCVFRPYFPPDDDPERFAAVHAVYGARRLATRLLDVPPELRGDATASYVYEARCRQQDPVLGVMGEIDVLNTAVKLSEELLAAKRKELARYIGEEAASRSFVPAHEPREVATMQELEDWVQAAAELVFCQSAADAGDGVTNFVTPLHEKLVKHLTSDVPGGNTSVTAAVPGPAQTAADILMQQPPSQAPTAAAGVQDPCLPEAEGAGDEPSQGSA